MSLEPTATPDGPPPREKQKDFLGFAILGGVLACLALVTLVSMARSVFKLAVPQNTPVQASGVSRSLIDFTLTNTAGQSVSRADFQNQWLIVNFVFSSCSLSCMEVNHRMAEIQKLVEDQPNVRLLSLTIDPRSDSPPVLAKFAARFSANTNRWLFLTGDKRVIYSVIEQSFLGPPDPKLTGIIPGGWNNADRIAIVDRRGEVRASFNGLKSSVTGEVMTALQKLQSESRQ